MDDESGESMEPVGEVPLVGLGESELVSLERPAMVFHCISLSAWCTLMYMTCTARSFIFSVSWGFWFMMQSLAELRAVFVNKQAVHFLCVIGCCCYKTHTRLTALFPGLPEWVGTRKVKPIWILLKQETVSGSGISWAIYKSASHSRQVTMPAPHHSVFYRPDALRAT